jgi:hypothetical protein
MLQTNRTVDINSVVSHFCIEGQPADAKPFGSGHINETYCVLNKSSDCPDYLLQRIHHIFKDVPGLMNNIVLVTNHLKAKLGSDPGAGIDHEVLTPIPTHNHKFYHRDENGDYWRMYHFLDANRYDMLETEQQAYEGGKAFGKFQALLADMDPALLIESIPNFHNVPSRLERFEQAVQKDAANRVKDVADEIAFVRERAKKMTDIQHDIAKLPVRIIHNDTKFNNVLLDKDDRAQCVIDLDTVMPGYVAFDFGDAIRTIINTAAEDEKDLEKIQLNVPLFKAYVKGYLHEAGAFLSINEIDSLMPGGLLIPYEQTVRFLTDYIEGDVYYKIHFQDHNLQRTRAQMELLKKIEGSYDALEEIVKEFKGVSSGL